MMTKLNEEQLRFFYNEVLGLMEWDEEVEASGIDPLQFVRNEVDGLRRQVRRLRARNYERVIDASCKVCGGMNGYHFTHCVNWLGE